MSYDAIIFDLDGTAIPSGLAGMPSAKLIETTKKYRNSINLCAATGRSWDHTKPVVSALGINKPCIVSGGTLILDPVSEQVLWQQTIDLETVQQIVDIVKRFDYEVSYTQGVYLVVRDSPDTLDIDAPVNTLYVLDMARGAEEEVIAALAPVKGITVSKAGAWFTDNGIDLHITNQRATKEHAVAELCKILGVESQNLAGVGDGFNDLHLFKAVGHKIAMGNAVPELKAAADQVIGDVNEDGLAQFIADAC